MATPSEVDTFLAGSVAKVPIWDVRSPGEYAKGHIPGALNRPLFNNEERKEVGTLYKQVGKEEAFVRGLEIIGPKMADFVRQATEDTPDRRLRVHCWRGGMRSASVAHLLRMASFQVDVLQGGYKTYRKWVQTVCNRPYRLIVLGGTTGSGKTDVLKALGRQGAQILDLEGLAHHKGSAFGGIGQLPQPKTEHFENKMAHELQQMDAERWIWVEDESRTIGHVFIPPVFFKRMDQAPVCVLDVPLDLRIARLTREYGTLPIEKLREALARIKKRVGGMGFQQGLTSLENSDYDTFARLTLRYYDKTYRYALDQRSPDQVHSFSVAVDAPDKTAEQLLNYIAHQFSLA